MIFLGYQLALVEIFIFGLVALLLRNMTNLYQIKGIVYFWVSFTILTGLWELFFVSNYTRVIVVAENLLHNQQHVWTQKYNVSNLDPSKFSQLFYAEYGAYGDREYMTKMDNWSRVIESSHSLLCGIFCLLAIGNYVSGNLPEYWFTLSIGMGSQLMNSILYLANYFIQVHDVNSVNYNTTKFPSGKFLEDRPFMYINILWTIMPIYVIFYLLLTLRTEEPSNDNKMKKNLQEDIETQL